MPLGKVAKIAIGWTVCVAAGIYAFYLSKESVIEQRYKHMKLRERMREEALKQRNTEQ